MTRIIFRAACDLVDRIDRARAETGASRSEWIRRAILAALEKIELNKKGK